MGLGVGVGVHVAVGVIAGVAVAVGVGVGVSVGVAVAVGVGTGAGVAVGSGVGAGSAHDTAMTASAANRQGANAKARRRRGSLVSPVNAEPPCGIRRGACHSRLSHAVRAGKGAQRPPRMPERSHRPQGERAALTTVAGKRLTDWRAERKRRRFQVGTREQSARRGGQSATLDSRLRGKGGRFCKVPCQRERTTSPRSPDGAQPRLQCPPRGHALTA